MTGVARVERRERIEVGAASALLTREALRVERRVRVTCHGGSMHPTLRAGDAVDVHAKEASVGDVVLFEQGAKLIVHRLVARFGPSGGDAIVVHCGDASWKSAGLSRASRVLGVVNVEPREGTEGIPFGRWAIAAWAVGRYGPRLALRAAHRFLTPAREAR